MSIDCCKSYVGKQIIGLLPGGSTQECLYYYAPDIQIYGWTIDGIISDDESSINNALSSYGYFYKYYLTLDFAESRLSLTYIGTEPPTYIPVILDSNGDPVTWSLTSCCTKVCIKQTYNANQYYYLETGYGWVAEIGDFLSDWDPINMPPLIQGLYGVDATYSAIDNGDGTWDITIDNAYICSPIAWSADDVTYVEMVDCSATKCAYYSQFVDNSNSCFYGGSYDFEGCLIDFNCLASKYPSGYFVQDAANLPFDYCSHLTVISTSYTPLLSINYLDYNGNPQINGWTPLCDFGCVQTQVIFKPTTTIEGLAFCGININFFSYGGPYDLFDTITRESFLFGVIKTYFPTCTGVTIDEDVNGFLTFKIFDVYYNLSAAPLFTFDDSLGFSHSLGLQGC